MVTGVDAIVIGIYIFLYFNSVYIMNNSDPTKAETAILEAVVYQLQNNDLWKGGLTGLKQQNYS